MRMSHVFGQTLREVPSEAKSPGHQLLLRSGFIRPLAAGIFSELNLARRSIAKIEKIMREELDAIGGQEISMPVVHPAEIWQGKERRCQNRGEMGGVHGRAKR